MIRRVSRLLVPMTSLREVPGSCLGRIPARASKGAVSSKIRPFDNAMLMLAMCHIRTRRCRSVKGAHSTTTLFDPLDARAEGPQLGLEGFVAAIEVVDAVDDGLAVSHQAGDDETRRSAQVGGHHGRALQLRHAAHDRAVALD